MGNKKKRKQKTSQGVHGGGGKVTLSELQKVLMGKGMYASLKPVDAKKRGD